MIKLNFNKKFIRLDGLESDVKINESLAKLLAHDQGDKVIKLMDWARALCKVGEIDVDRADAIWLRNYIEKSPNATVILKEQLMNCIVIK